MIMVKINDFMKQKIKQYIQDKNICVIATCFENKPRVSTVNYIPDGFTLYIVTSGKSIKCKNIKANPNVSIVIDDQGRQEKACLQAEGVAEILDGAKAEQARKFYSQKRDISHHNPELIDMILKIDLREIIFSDYTEEGLKVYKFKVGD